MLVLFSDNFFVNFLGNLFLTFLIILIFFIILLLLTSIKIDLKCIDKKYKLELKFYIFGKIRYLKIKLDRSQLIKAFDKFRLKIFKDNNSKMEKDLYKNRKIIKNAVEKLKLDLEYLNLDLMIGTEFMLLTTVIVTTISTVFPMLLNKFINKFNYKKCNYKFTPIYNKNDIKLQLHCIINIKMVHIINVIISIMLKKGVFKNVRTSNTRFNDNCYE